MLMKTLRDDQATIIQQIRAAVMQEEHRIVVQCPTGFGKGLLIADIISRALIKDKRVMVLVPVLSLIDQTVDVLKVQGVNAIGVIQSNNPMTDTDQPVQVCSVQTLQHRWQKQTMPKADVVLIDEVHRWFSFFPKWLCDMAWQHVPFIGFSATPWTKGLGAYYNRLIVGSDIERLIEQNTLVPFRTFAPDVPDLRGVREQAGDFMPADLDEIMRPKKLVANIVETWMALGEGRPTVCFCCSRAHADQVAKEFAESGIPAVYMDCNTKMLDWVDEEGESHEGRRTIRRKFLAGEYRVICNVEIVGIGVDWPEVSCIIYARPTMSDMRFVQNIGRGLRSHPGKIDLLILDHSSTTMRLGFVNEVYALHKALDDGKAKAEAVKIGVALPKPCPACNYLKAPRTAVCPNCGHKAENDAKPVLVERGTLREIKAGDEMADWRKKLPDKANVFGQLCWWGRSKGYKPGWAAVKCKEIFGSFPRAREPDPETIGMPTPELLQYIYELVEKWKKKQYYAKRQAQRSAKSEDGGALSERDQAILDRVRQQAETLMSEADMQEDWK